jgi:cation diffusion facilitator CzcD-associated flavoprotein CzcO
VTPELDAVVVGAGVSGIYQLHRLRQVGLSTRLFEAGSDIGGTWHRNRYPGARFDSESYSYGYSFSPEVLANWQWSEHFAGQPETHRYLTYVADVLDLRRDISLGVHVRGARYDERHRFWRVDLEDQGSVTCRFLFAAIGLLSAPNVPRFPGAGEFRGSSFHTTGWPEGLRLDGLRVGVVGTGATGVQVIQEAAKVAERLTVFQRTASWCAPLHNRPISGAEQQDILVRYPQIFERCRSTFAGFIHDADRRKALQVSAEERADFYEELYSRPGFGLWVGNFRDVLVNAEANATLSEFMAEKIRQRVHDRATAERLVPRDHGFGTRRVPLETGYYEVYNQANVELVDVGTSPITGIGPAGVQTAERDYPLDVLVYATGFDAVTGAFERMDFRGEGGTTLKQAWRAGPKTYLGLQTSGFPNLFSIAGPQSSTTFCNMPRCIEANVEFVSDLVAYVLGHGFTAVAPTRSAQNEWVEDIRTGADRMLYSKVSSWFTGRNRPGSKAPAADLLYTGGFPSFLERCETVAAGGYEGFVLR